jgi:hypothetical protein
MNNSQKEQPNFCGDILKMALSDKYFNQGDTYFGQDRDERTYDTLFAAVTMAQCAEWSKETYLDVAESHWDELCKSDEAA